MDVSHILAPLNDAQRQAVTAPLMPTLVLAGAGSGKTRVLTHRVEWLVQVEGVSPHGILAVTFTNKAAAEMRQRIETQLGLPSAPLWIGTFHGISHRLLRLHWREAGLPQGFHILDSEDQQRLVKKIIRGLNLDDTRWVPREVAWFINKQKDEGLRPQHLKDEGDATRRQMIKLYEAYEVACRRNGVVDFAELLLRSCEILRDTPGLAEHYRSRFRHVLVDEFQDTNTVQYEWMKVLTGATGIPYVVGDDDQSIYRWRGARVENLQQYRKDYHGVQLFRLEQNYRSTGNILAAANAVISNNTGRIGKKLWTSDGAGTPIRLYRAYNERDEAEFVVNKIREWVARGGNRRDNAILYRSNAQSRVFEEYLLAARIPYRVYGGLRFFERQEIKDALAYLRLISNRDDDASFERVVNLPTRGIGARTIEVLRAHSRAHSVSMWQSASACGEDLGAKATSCLQAFLTLIEKLDAETRGMALHEQVDHVIQAGGLVGHYQKEKADKGEARLENLEELVSAASGFQPEDGDLSPLMAFLSHAVLESGEGQAEEWEDCVQMMTLHSAKGLEFPVVFLCGMEDGLFPHQRSVTDVHGLEEERRLCYVGVTRAMKQLYCTYAEQRRMHGIDSYGAPSRFLAELPPELVEEVRPRVNVSRPAYMPQSHTQSRSYQSPGPGRAGAGSLSMSGRRFQDDTPGNLKLGQRVRHAKFGDGVVLSVEGQGDHARVQINFERQGTKWLMMGYANLEMV
jgi:DNA helicase-2/ATP-dependent DNA helicase PcrA